MDYIIKRCKYTDYVQEVNELAKEHWKEVGGMPGCPNLALSLDVEQYRYFENNKTLICYGIFDEQELIGYFCAFVFTSHQHEDKIMAQSDGYFIRKDKRGLKSLKAILQVVRLAERELKDEYGVEYMFLRTNTNKDLQALAYMLRYTPASIEFAKELK